MDNVKWIITYESFSVIRADVDVWLFNIIPKVTKGEKFALDVKKAAAEITAEMIATGAWKFAPQRD